MEARFVKYDEIIFEKLRIVHVDDEKVVGVLYNFGELKDLRDHLHQYNFWFSTRSVDKHYENRLSIHWVLPKLQGAPPQGVALNDNAPFIITRVVNKDCRRGRAYWKKKSECSDGDDGRRDGEVGKVRKRKPYRTIKSDCPAKMTVRHIVAYPQFAVSSDTSKKMKGKFANLLKQAIIQDEAVGEERFVVSVSRASHHHSHPSEVPRNTPVPLHPLVARYVTTLVAGGNVASPRAIKTLVTQFSRETFNENEASPHDRCFYPMVKDIRELLRRLVRDAEASEQHCASLEEEVSMLEPDDPSKAQGFSSVDEPQGKISTPVNDSEDKDGSSDDHSFSRLLSAADQPITKIFTSNDEPHDRILTPVLQPLTHIFTPNIQPDSEVFAPVDEPVSKIILKDECEGIVDDGAESLVMEKQIIVMSEGYLTLQFTQDPSEDDCVTMHIASPHNSPARQEALLDVKSPFPNLTDVDVVSSEKVKLVSALERTFQQVASVSDLQH